VFTFVFNISIDDDDTDDSDDADLFLSSFCNFCCLVRENFFPSWEKIIPSWGRKNFLKGNQEKKTASDRGKPPREQEER
jgi:hypothetical protein